MTPVFNVADPATWPMVMSIDQVSEIYSRSVGAIREACRVGRFQPAPFMRCPLRFRKVDVLRHVEGARGGSLRRIG